MCRQAGHQRSDCSDSCRRRREATSPAGLRARPQPQAVARSDRHRMAADRSRLGGDFGCIRSDSGFRSCRRRCRRRDCRLATAPLRSGRQAPAYSAGAVARSIDTGRTCRTERSASANPRRKPTSFGAAVPDSDALGLRIRRRRYAPTPVAGPQMRRPFEGALGIERQRLIDGAQKSLAIASRSERRPHLVVRYPDGARLHRSAHDPR